MGNSCLWDPAELLPPVRQLWWLVAVPDVAYQWQIQRLSLSRTRAAYCAVMMPRPSSRQLTKAEKTLTFKKLELENG